MSDQALELILRELHLTATNRNQSLIWCTDENALNGLDNVAHPNLQVITNRWDVAEQARHRNFETQFSDFDFAHHNDETIDGIFYRVSKEKALVHHILNQAWRCLKPGGEIWLAGFKDEGIKTYIEKIAALLGCDKSIKKSGQVYSARLIKKSTFNPLIQLDDCDYAQIRSIAPQSEFTLVSKPGMFGWNKIDAGSALLISQLDDALAGRPAPQTCVDLGCGYGFLTIAAARSKFAAQVKHWTLTDNNAAALKVADENLRINGIPGEVIGADAGQGLSNKAELLLCNPPFHQGFTVDGDLTDKFLSSASRLLALNGIAIFVVNKFIPLERKAVPIFKNVKTLIDNGSFKVISLSF